MIKRIIDQINQEIASLTEDEKQLFDVKSRYHELVNEMLQEEVDDEVWKLVYRDYSEEDLIESLKNPNEW